MELPNPSQSQPFQAKAAHGRTVGTRTNLRMLSSIWL
jgi:hypothetical protein